MAKDDANKRTQELFLEELEHNTVTGRWGFTERTEWWSTVNCNASAGMDGTEFTKAVKDAYMPLYPDLAPIPGKREVLLVDLGPGHDDDKLQIVTAAKGLYILTRVPNTTHIWQPTDMNYGPFQTFFSQKEDKIEQLAACKKTHSAIRRNPTACIWRTQDTNLHVDEERILQGFFCKKIEGNLAPHWYPHEVTTLRNGSVDLTADPMTAKLLDLELCNSSNAAPRNKEKQKIASIEPGWNEQILKIATAKTAGQKFRVTDGFVITNSNDKKQAAAALVAKCGGEFARLELQALKVVYEWKLGKKVAAAGMRKEHAVVDAVYDSNLSFADLAEKYKWDFTPPSQSRGPLTQEAALGLLDMIKPEDQRAQMTARMEELPLVIDEQAAAGAGDDDDENMIEEITEEETMTEQQPTATTTTTKTIDLALDEPPTRPARVSIEPPRSILRNPYRRRGRKEAQTRTTIATTTTTEQPTATNDFDMTASAQEHTEKIYNNANHFNTFGEKGEEYALAETITRKYSKMKNSTHNRFHKIVREATDPTTNNPGDAVLHEMFTKEVRMKNHLEVDYLFYYNVSGPRNMHKRTILDQALKIWTTRIANAKDAFHARDVQFAAADFNFQGGFKGVLQKDWNNKREADPTIGTKRTNAEFDEFVDEKFAKVVTDATNYGTWSAFG
eukprot:jgi/Psemu1/32375/gm1.32375_g